MDERPDSASEEPAASAEEVEPLERVSGEQTIPDAAGEAASSASEPAPASAPVDPHPQQPVTETPVVASEDGRERNRQLYETARTAEEAGDWQGAIAALRQLTMRPGEDVAVHFRLQSLMWRQKAQEHVAQAQVALEAKQWQQAYTIAESALNLWPGMRDAEAIREAAKAGMRRRRVLSVLASIGLLLVIVGGAGAFALIMAGGPPGGSTPSPTAALAANPSTEVPASPSPTATPTATESPTPTATASATSTPAPTQTPAPTATVVPTATATVRVVAPVVYPTRTPTRRPPTNTPIPPTETPTETPLPTATATTAPTETPTAAPTNTPVPPPPSQPKPPQPTAVPPTAVPPTPVPPPPPTPIITLPR